MSTSGTPASLQDWIGRQERRTDQITDFPLAALAASLDREPPERVPPLWHWLYFLPTAPQAGLGPDGHARKGDFLPAVSLPRRMWAGGRLSFHAPLGRGDRVMRESTIDAVEDKTGRSGRLVFVTVRHEVFAGDVLCVEEEHDIVYRDAPAPGAPARAPVRAPEGERWSRQLSASPVLLFRYSALTFNGHRIHYDEPYATGVEGYPGLVVHGPLLATLLVDLLERHLPGAVLATFAFRAVRPVFADHPFTLCGLPSEDDKTIELWAKDEAGCLVMQATATLA